MGRRIRGYSLYELLMTLTLIARSSWVWACRLSPGLIARNRQHVEINALFHAIHLARKESIVRHRDRLALPQPGWTELRAWPGLVDRAG